MENKADRIPIISPVLLLLKSRRVLTAVIVFLVSLLIMAVPELAEIKTELLTLALVLGLVLIGGLSLEDAAAAGRGANMGTPADNLRSIVDAILEGLLNPGDDTEPDSDPDTVIELRRIKRRE